MELTNARRAAQAAALLLLPVLAPSCGAAPQSDVDASMGDDSSTAMSDSAVDAPGNDAATPDDAASTNDAASGPDAGVIDADSDGVPAAQDCDDADPLVGRSGTRACSTACNTGSEICTAGTWGACSAPTDCACTTPGMTRVTSCGMCGMGSQTCGADGTWGPVGTCFAEGECAVGAVAVEALPMCGERQRLCDGTCHWLPWMNTIPQGACEAGATQRVVADCTLPSQTRGETCGADCTWGPPTGPCQVSCTRTARPSLSGADPVCIPAGPFFLGYDPILAAAPMRTITLSEYYVDRYPVTRARYQMCVDAGACPIPGTGTAYAALRPTQWVNYTGFTEATAFCTWDGGQMLTEFQWEKAARGATPDARVNTWGDTDGTDCVEHAGTACNEIPFDVGPTVMPGAVSPWGVRYMGILAEATATHFRGGWSWLADGTTDPPDPTTATPTLYTYRGDTWLDTSGHSYVPTSSVSPRSGLTSGRVYEGFRCAY